ncbi:hypothetical protein DY000_02026133 [Brassica cretica]|uniref:ABC transporter domain-containing protein n=1 Tax=Brassica cretica TaxID=69181 RepID=A0ABQ7EJH0_BRACR|nr:hypothetical protein DY000_02026133 [Brassica cretica]
MGKKKPEHSAATMNDGICSSRKVEPINAGMDKPKKSSSSRAKTVPKVSSDENQGPMGNQRSKPKQLDFSVADKKQKKQEILALEAVEIEDDHDAFTVVIGSKTSVLEGQDTGDANVKDITISSFSVSVRGKELLKNASLMISHGKRYGLVGPNGMGKSTLLKLLAWRKISVPKNIDILLVEQEVIGDGTSALEAVVSSNEELFKLRKEAEALEATALQDSPSDDDNDDTGVKLSQVYDKLQELRSDAAEAQASKILVGLGFTEEKIATPTKLLSGGWRMRISLARALFVQPTLLLLDEPTNHLDLRAVLWLEEYLCRWKNTLVVVSHNVDFLNTVCTDIIHLHDQNLHLYRGNFDAFETGYDQRRKEMNKKFDIYEKRVKAAKRSGNRAQQEKVKDWAKFTAGKEASKRKSKGEEGPAQEAPRKWRDYSVVLDFPEPTELPPPLLQLKEVSFSYPNRQGFRLSDVDLAIDMGTRVAIVGPNGAGKSTLLNLVAGYLTPTEGEVRRSQKLRIGWYSQHFVDQLTMEETPVQYLLRLYPDQEGCSKQEAVRAKLGKFGLPGHNHLTPIGKLSGGQKARVVLASISMGKPHILLLDEPTNHLDMQTIDALADALDGFKGGVVLVSHDSRLISRVCEEEDKSEIWVVEDGSVTFFDGIFEEYKEELKREIKTEVDDLTSLQTHTPQAA